MILIPILLLLPFAVKAIEVLESTKNFITVTLPSSVCDSLRVYLIVTDQEKIVRVELQDSLAIGIGVPTFDFIRIDERTSCDEIHKEYYHGIGSQKVTKDLMDLLYDQKEAGLLSDLQFHAWFSHQSLMLKERGYIINSIRMIRKTDSSLSTGDVLSIFKWRQGSYDLLEFIHTVLMRNEPWFWRIVSFQYRAPAESLAFITVTPLHESIFSPLGASHYNFVRIKPDTKEYVFTKNTQMDMLIKEVLVCE
jgi:hypothetical protein